MITDADDYDSRFICHDFNITASNASTTAAPSSTTQECDSTSTASSGTCSKTGSSPQAKVEISVSVGLSCAFLIALDAAIWYFHRRTAAAVCQAKLSMAWCEPDNTQYPHQQSRPGFLQLGFKVTWLLITVSDMSCLHEICPWLFAGTLFSLSV